MIITIDTQKDTPSEIRKAISLLEQFANHEHSQREQPLQMPTARPFQFVNHAQPPVQPLPPTMTTFFDDAPQPVKPAHHAVAEELTFDLKDELKEERPKHPVTKHFFETY